MSSTSWIWRIFATPRPEIASISTRPGGICSRRSSSMLARPVVTISATIWSVAGPTPFVAARLPSSRPSRRSPVKLPTARAAVRKARMRNGFSPLSSRKAAIWSSTCATAFLSMKLRTASVIGGSGQRVGQRAGAPPSSSSSSPPDERVEPRGLPAGEHRREERRAIGSLERDRPRPRGLDRAESLPLGPQAEDAEHPELGAAGVNEAAVHGLGGRSSTTRAQTCRSSSWA